MVLDKNKEMNYNIIVNADLDIIKESVEEFIDKRKTGVISLQFNFYKGGITNREILLKETKKN